MTCPHCNGTGEIKAPGWDPVALGWTSFFGSPDLSGVPLVDHRAWLASQMAQTKATTVNMVLGQMLAAVIDTCVAEDFATARALAETGHLGEAP